jgi:hypothetical protein
MAMTRRTWMKPPMVYEDTKPSSHKIIRITAIVSSIGQFSFMFCPADAGGVMDKRLCRNGSLVPTPSCQ